MFMGLVSPTCEVYRLIKLMETSSISPTCDVYWSINHLIFSKVARPWAIAIEEVPQQVSGLVGGRAASFAGLEVE